MTVPLWFIGISHPKHHTPSLTRHAVYGNHALLNHLYLLANVDNPAGIPVEHGGSNQALCGDVSLVSIDTPDLLMQRR
jgi:hypothetical protein